MKSSFFRAKPFVLLLLCLLFLALMPPLIAPPAYAALPLMQRPVPGECVEGTLPGGALSLVCVPSRGWNGDLVVWAHGYVAFNEPLDFYHLQAGDLYIPDLMQSLGYAFATTSYRTNGLAILPGTEDIQQLVAAFPAVVGQPPDRVFLTGASEGGIISALLAEQSPNLFDGVLATCGPIGDFQQQLNYYGDFRVLFDYFFPGILPGPVTAIPQELIDGWDSVYVPQIRAALAADPAMAVELLKVAEAPYQLRDSSTIENTTLSLLWYNVFATNDALSKLGGNPYDNTSRSYQGSSDDIALNLGVQRYRADPEALAAVESYNTSGQVTLPLVTLHTTGDELIPMWHERLYRQKADVSGEGQLTQIPIHRYGHCNFTEVEALASFFLLVFQATRDMPSLEYLPATVDVAAVQGQLERMGVTRGFR
ncbi:MAG: hypothetical protein M3220_10400 [Chloroflexota bacterium]|nr:hypothetical protein [Chloroflexota bacterium]